MLVVCATQINNCQESGYGAIMQPFYLNRICVHISLFHVTFEVIERYNIFISTVNDCLHKHDIFSFFCVNPFSFFVPFQVGR